MLWGSTYKRHRGLIRQIYSQIGKCSLYLNHDKFANTHNTPLFTYNANIHEHNTRYHNDPHQKKTIVLFIGLQHYGTQLRQKLKTSKLLPPFVRFKEKCLMQDIYTDNIICNEGLARTGHDVAVCGLLAPPGRCV